MNNKRKGISTFIATLLLMVLAVAAGVVIYAYTMGYLGGFGGPQTMGAISIDTWKLDTDANTLTVYVRNIGKATFVLQSVYINGQGWDVDGDGVYEPNEHDKISASLLELKETEVKVLTITSPFEPATTYDIKLIGIDNTQMSFQAKK